MFSDDYDGKHIDNSRIKLTPGIRVVRAAKSHSTIIKLFREDGGVQAIVSLDIRLSRKGY